MAPKVAVVVDSASDPSRGRACFWKEALADWPEIEVQLVSFPEQRDKRVLFNFFDYDVIILNWDVMDGDCMFESDVTQRMVHDANEYLRQFVAGGGLLVIECQANKFKPNQTWYDLVLEALTRAQGLTRFLPPWARRQVWLRDEPGETRWSDTVLVNDAASVGGLVHPLLENLSGTISTTADLCTSKDWFPRKAVAPHILDTIDQTPRRMYSGGFAMAYPEWIPLLLSHDSERLPVLCARTWGEGLYVISTMYLASSNHRQFLQRLIREWPDRCTRITGFHNQYVPRVRRTRYFLWSLAGLAFVGILIWLTRVLVWSFRGGGPSWYWTWLPNFLFGFVFLVLARRFLRELVRMTFGR